MTRDEILKLAHEAATEDGSTSREDGKDVVLYAAKTNRFLERFAALVAEAEREECAAICDRFQARDVGMQPAECAGAIRARGKK